MVYTRTTLPKIVVSALLFGFVSLFLNYEMALQAIPSIFAQHFMAGFDSQAAGLGVISASFFLTYSIMQIPAGLILDRSGLAKPLLLAILACTLGTCLLSLSHSILLASFARAIEGIGGAFAFLTTLYVARMSFSRRTYPLLVGITQCMAALGPMIAQDGIIYLAQHIHWRDLLLVIGLLGFLLIAVIGSLLHVVKHKSAVSCQIEKQSQADVFSSLKEVLTHKIIWMIGVYALLLWGPIVIFAELWGPTVLKGFFNLSKVSASELTSFMWFGLAIGSVVGGWVLKKSFAKISTMLILTATIGLLVSIWLLFTHTVAISSIAIVLIGAGCAGQALSFTLVRKVVSQKLQSTAAAFNNTAIVLSGVIFQPLSGWLLDSNGVSATSHNGFHLIVLLIIVIFALALGVAGCLYLKESEGYSEPLKSIRSKCLNVGIAPRRVS